MKVTRLHNGHRVTESDIRLARLIIDLDKRSGGLTSPLITFVASAEPVTPAGPATESSVPNSFRENNSQVMQREELSETDMLAFSQLFVQDSGDGDLTESDMLAIRRLLSDQKEIQNALLHSWTDTKNTLIADPPLAARPTTEPPGPDTIGARPTNSTAAVAQDSPDSLRTQATVRESTASARPSDADLLKGMRNGDENSWSLLVDRYSALVYAVGVRFGVPRESLVEVVQSTFISLIKSAPNLRQDDRLASWLITAAHRKAWRITRGLERSRAAEPPPNSIIQ